MTERLKFKLENLDTKYVEYDKSRFKINADFVNTNMIDECYRELMVSYIQLVPLFQGDEVCLQNADYILYSHSYARREDLSDIVLEELAYIDSQRKDGAEIIVLGKACNIRNQLNGSIKNITFLMEHFVKRLGDKFGVDINDMPIVYDSDENWLAIWPVNGCLQKCKFCRRSYMHIPFESLSLDTIKSNLDVIRETHPERLCNISLRAENLTEYGIDLYGHQCLEKVIDLLDSYEEIKTIDFSIGLNIGEITPEILSSLCRLKKKIVNIALNFETGTNRLLKLIGKPHSVEKAEYVFSTLKKAHPDIYITSMIMVGLPTETVGDIYELAQLISRLQPNSIGVNYYFCAPRQPLAVLPQLSESAKEYHVKCLLKFLSDILCFYPDEELEVYHPEVFKNKKSRNFGDLMNYLARMNQIEDYPSNYFHTTLFKP